MTYKVIERGEVTPVETIEQVARRMADAHGRGVRDFRVRACRDRSAVERPLTVAEMVKLLDVTAAIVSERVAA